MQQRSGKLNVRLLAILVAVAALLGGAAVTARHVRRQILAARDLKAGLAAFEKGDWALAGKHLKEYLGRQPDDVEILDKYARAQLSIEPLEVGNILGAISAYRRLVNLRPKEEEAYERLATLYLAVGNFSELTYTAGKRLEESPNDPKARIWIAKALVSQHEFDEARKALVKLEGDLVGRGKHIEYVQVCTLLSLVAGQEETEEARAEARKWAERCVETGSDCYEARVFCARFLRKAAMRLLRDEAALDASATEPLLEQASKAAKTKANLLPAVADIEQSVAHLERAGTLKPVDPAARLVLVDEWLAQGELKQAEAALAQLDDAGPEEIRKYLVDPKLWEVRRFLLKATFLGRKQENEEGVKLADAALAAMTAPRHRIRIFPAAVRLYVSGGSAVKARACLKEYLDLLKVGQEVGRSVEATDEQLAVLKAMVAYAEERPYQVIEDVEPIIRADSSNTTLLKVLAAAYSQTNQTAQAIRVLLQYVKLRPRDVEMSSQLVREYIKLSNWRGAYRAAMLAEPEDPTNIVIQLLRIETSVYLAVEQDQSRRTAWLGSLVEELAGLRAKHPDDLDVRLLQAYMAFEEGRYDDAIAELKLAIEECEETLRAELQLAAFYFRRQQTDEAIDVCRNACKRHPEKAEPWRSLARLQQLGKNVEQAVATLKEGLKAATGRWEQRELTLRLAVLQVLDGDRSLGIDLLKTLAKKDIHEVHARDLLLGLGEILKDESEAARLIDEIRQIEGETGRMWRLHLASLRLTGRDWRSRQQEIEALLKWCMDSSPDWSTPALMLARMHEELGNLDRAEAACRRVLASNPAAVEAADHLVSLLERHRWYKDAEDVLAQLEASPRILSARRVRMAVGKGDFARAIDELRLRLANDEHNRDVASRILLARLIYWETRDWRQALNLLSEAQAMIGVSGTITAVRVEIFRAEALYQEEEGRRLEGEGQLVEARKRREQALARHAEARQILDEQVAKEKDFRAYLLRALYLESVGELPAAEKDYTHLTTFKDYPGRGHRFLGQFYEKTGESGKAVTALEDGARVYPDDLALKRALMNTLFRSKEEGDRDRAMAILAEMEKRLPDDPEVMWLRAKALLAEGADESEKRARQLIERVVRVEPTAVEPHRALIALAMKRGEYGAARELAIRAQGANPGNIRLTLARAVAEQKTSNFEMAKRLASIIIEEDPENTAALGVIADAAVGLYDVEAVREARASIEEVLKKKSKDHLLLAKSSMLYRFLGELGEAEKRIAKAVELAPDNSTVLHERIALYREQGNSDGIVATAKAYEVKAQRGTDVILSAASALASFERTEDRAKAVGLYERAISIAPGLTIPRIDLGVLVYDLGDADRAEKLYREVIAMDPSNPMAYNNLAWVVQEARKDFSTALKLANKGIGLASSDRHLYDTRGVILSQIPGREEDARADSQRCLDLTFPDTPARAKALLQLGRICTKLKDLPRAKAYLDRAIEIDGKIGVFKTEERDEIAKLLKDASPEKG